MVANRKGLNSLGGTTGCEAYEVRPHENGDGVDLISDRFRYGPIWYAGPDAVRRAVAYARPVLSRARTGRSSACFMKRATSSKRTSTKASPKSGERSRYGFRTEQKAATMPPPMSDSQRRWRQMSELIKHARITSA